MCIFCAQNAIKTVFQLASGSFPLYLGLYLVYIGSNGRIESFPAYFRSTSGSKPVCMKCENINLVSRCTIFLRHLMTSESF